LVLCFSSSLTFPFDPIVDYDNFLAERAIAPSVTLSGGALFAS